MTTPTRPVPATVEAWISRSVYLRWADAVAAGAIVFAVARLLLREPSDGAVGLIALAALAMGALLRGVRTRWRPVSGWIGLRVSRSLRPGDRAWFVRHGRADAVLVTARHGGRLSLGGVSVGDSESLTVRRTRVLVIPHDGLPM